MTSKRARSSSVEPVTRKYSVTTPASIATFPEPAQCRSRPSFLMPDTQYASRFTAMSAAKTRAKELQMAMVMDYNRAKRGEADNRIKEIVNAMNVLNG